MVQEYDEPILKHLADIQLKFHDEPMGFTLEFHFLENEFFTNKVLTKYYEMKCSPDKEDPFGFEGPEIFKCKVCLSILFCSLFGQYIVAYIFKQFLHLYITWKESVTPVCQQYTPSISVN